MSAASNPTFAPFSCCCRCRRPPLSAHALCIAFEPVVVVVVVVVVVHAPAPAEEARMRDCCSKERRVCNCCRVSCFGFILAAASSLARGAWGLCNQKIYKLGCACPRSPVCVLSPTVCVCVCVCGISFLSGLPHRNAKTCLACSNRFLVSFHCGGTVAQRKIMSAVV